MNIRISLIALVGVLFLGSSFTMIEAPIKKWVRMGSKKVSFKLDKDVIYVGGQEGRFDKLKVLVTGGNINMHKMIVEYGNGTKDNIQLKHNFRRGSDSRIIDLEGGKRVIKDITFWYDTKNNSKNRATLHVFGHKSIHK